MLPGWCRYHDGGMSLGPTSEVASIKVGLYLLNSWKRACQLCGEQVFLGRLDANLQKCGRTSMKMCLHFTKYSYDNIPINPKLTTGRKQRQVYVYECTTPRYCYLAL